MLFHKYKRLGTLSRDGKVTWELLCRVRNPELDKKVLLLSPREGETTRDTKGQSNNVSPASVF